MRTLLLSLVLALAAPFAYAGTYQGVLGEQFTLNKASPEGLRKYQLGTIVAKRRKYSQKCTYNFALSGGSTAAAISLLDPDGKACKLPQNGVITTVYIDTLTALTSGGSATVALSTGQTTADVKAATGYASYTGILAAIPVGTAATAIKLTADRTPTATIATATLTAGKFNVVFEYFISD